MQMSACMGSSMHGQPVEHPVMCLPALQLLVCTLAPAVFSATTDNFKPWCSAAGNGGSVACSMSASNVNFGASMLKNMMRLTAAISSTGKPALGFCTAMGHLTALAAAAYSQGNVA